MPLTFDLPWDTLQTYTGRSPRPADFDAYWAAGLAELDRTPPHPEFTDAEFQTPFAQCSHLHFAGIGGARIHAMVARPRHAIGAQPLVLAFHGYGGNAGSWVDKLAWAAAGYTILALDCRGQGGTSEDAGVVKGPTLHGHIIRGLEGAPEDLLYRSIFLDTVQLARIGLALPGIDPSRVATVGGSQGGALALVCAALEPRVTVATATFPFLCDYRRVWEMDLGEGAYSELQQYFRLHDPLHRREAELFERLGYIDVQNFADRIKAEVRMTVSLMDKVCPPSTQFSAYNKITSKKSLVVYPDYGHEGLPGADDKVFDFIQRQFGL